MIVKVAPPRKDKRSSFFRLTDYLIEGHAGNGIDPRDTSFERITRYVSADTALNELGDVVEKTIAIETGNVSSLQNAATEMWAVAMKNHGACDNPVFHYILSWPEHERPPVDDVMQAARNTLTALGLSDHQFVIAVHGNTDNLHAHIAVNKIHPRTYMSRHLEWSHKTLHKSARESEIQFGWSHDNGLWQVVEVDGKKLVLPNNDYVERSIDILSSSARDFEVWTGKESFETYCKGEPAKALQKTLRTRPLTWQTIHQALSRYGIELKDTGGGGLRVDLVAQEDDKPVSVAASRAFRFLKRKELEKTLGPFQAIDPNAPAAPKVRTYKRDPIKRTVRRLERHAQREALFQQYELERDTVKAQRAKIAAQLKHSSKAANAERYRLIKVSYLAKRQQLKNDKTIDGKQKQQAYSILKMTYEVAKEELQEQIADERRQINELMPKLKSWRTWVEEQAQEGNEAAVSALRGMVYQEKRDAKKDGAEEIEDQVPSIRPAPACPDDAPSIKRVFSNLEWRVSSNGRVFYHFRKTQALAFIDEGRRLTFGRDIVDDESLAATLRYAKTKWGNSLHITGGENVFRERVVRLAMSMGMTIENPELQHIQDQFQTSKARTAPVAAATSDIREQTESALAKIAIVEKMRLENPDANIVNAVVQDRTYRGKIASVDETHALQLIGENLYALHQLAALDTRPEIGTDLVIRYRAGAGRLMSNKSQGR